MPPAAVLGKVHFRIVRTGSGTGGIEEVDGGLVLLRRGISGSGQRSAVRIVGIVGGEGGRVVILEEDNGSCRCELPVFPPVEHVGVAEAAFGDAYLVTFRPGGTAGAGGYGVGNFGVNHCGHGAVVQVLVVVGAGSKRECQCREGE